MGKYVRAFFKEDFIRFSKVRIMEGEILEEGSWWSTFSTIAIKTNKKPCSL